ncbi:SDR family oxidoreductase [Natronosporangium hydrolyticum]|uniref:SDR family oxidoreductase n=1 Tax=Natronosporangium hydrolyticum TaxID=2811111 RepID=A0A895YKF5_9ACTN|nr:SDR family oxidoreductase [Natronosporangium hydrolyticum]QSB15116.1 SDR family oxidoreductase [Natronosporangium hydrolyticum]
MTIAVTGATGQLGRRVVAALLAQGVPADGIVAAVRDPARAAEFAEHGVQVRQADYDRPETLATAFADVRRLLLISANDPSRRMTQHLHVVSAAVDHAVELFAYTSALHAQRNPMLIAADHRATELLIAESGLRHVVLRNGWYTENYTQNLAEVTSSGVLPGCARDGEIAAAPRADYAAAAAAVLTDPPADDTIYELGGDEPFTMAQLADEIGRQAGSQVVYQDLPVREYVATLAGQGMPEPQAMLIADSDLNVARGYLTTDSGDLRRLLGRPTTPLAEVLAAAQMVQGQGE